MTAANEFSKNWQTEFEKFKQSFEKLSFVNVEDWKDISRALEHLQSDHLQKYPTQNTESPGKEFGIIGESESLCSLLNLIRKIAPSDSTVLISGENGTGKEGTAKALHKLSPRGQKGAPFSIVNCGALSENLLESELFGHVKGAFTGAHVDKKGHFETAHEGTLFLD